MYKNKYLKYKNKYFKLYNQYGGFKLNDISDEKNIFSKIIHFLEIETTNNNSLLKLYNKLLKYVNNYNDFKNYYNKLLQSLYEIDEDIIIIDNTIETQTKYTSFIQNLTLYLDILNKIDFYDIFLSYKINIYDIYNININNKILITTLNKSFYKITEIKIPDLITKIVTNSNRKKMIEYLLTLYTINTEYYHIEYSSFIYISFIIEFEYFLIIYSRYPYNYNEDGKRSLNDFKILWDTNEILSTIYNKKFKDNIVDILIDYIDKIEKLYEQFINKLEQKFKDTYEDFDNTQFYNISHIEDYSHLNYEFFKAKDKLDTIIDTIEEIYPTYNPQSNSFFDYVFSNNNSCSCISYTMIDFYLLSRLHLTNFVLFLQKKVEIHKIDETKDDDTKLEEVSVYNKPNTQQKLYLRLPATHWSTLYREDNGDIVNIRVSPELSLSINIERNDKLNIFLGFFIVVVDRYLEILYYNDNDFIDIKNIKSKKLYNQLIKMINIGLLENIINVIKQNNIQIDINIEKQIKYLESIFNIEKLTQYKFTYEIDEIRKRI